jgi:DNA transformation protein
MFEFMIALAGGPSSAAKGRADPMPVSADILEYARDLFSGIGGIATRRMFGGAGVYSFGVMFALIDDDRIFLKTDEALKTALADEGAVAWIYTSARQPWPEETSYWSLPEAACDDPDEACAWGRRALAAAQAIKAARPFRKARKTSPARGRGTA